MRGVLLYSALFVLACAAPREPVGGKCEALHECENGLICLDGNCATRKLVGEKCDPTETEYRRHCEYGLECSRLGICETEEIRAARLAVELLENEQNLLRQSGIEPTAAMEPTAELPAIAPAGGSRVRVVRTKGKGVAFAVCGEKERLTGGGCDPTFARRSYPSHHSETDTAGARWNCELGEGVTTEIEAYALCQAVE